MIFVFKRWENFCRSLEKKQIHSVTAGWVLKGNAVQPYLVLKHDVETDVGKAYQMAVIENRFHHNSTYYVQAYLLQDKNNVALLQKMQAMGHEISYHYDVMDSCKGDIEKALAEFEKNRKQFTENGFIISTVCQHGNPVVERVGYTSNRDFFRSERVQKQFPQMADIMVDYKEKTGTVYLYFSDAGRKFKLIFDPINNDVLPSDDKNISFDGLEPLFSYIEKSNCIISTHPHRWTNSAFLYVLKTGLFKVIRAVAKVAMKIPFLKRIMSRYYYLAKKI